MQHTNFGFCQSLPFGPANKYVLFPHASSSQAPALFRQPKQALGKLVLSAQASHLFRHDRMYGSKFRGTASSIREVISDRSLTTIF